LGKSGASPSRAKAFAPSPGGGFHDLPANQLLTGYFGMNFNWMAERLGNGWVFRALGVLLPVACAGVTVVWLKRRGVL
jgi:hypothetical protein